MRLRRDLRLRTRKKALASAIEDPLYPMKADFRNFVFKIWEYLRLPSPSWIQYDIAHYLQHGPERRMVQAFRGVGKSWLTAAYVIWRLFVDPEERIMVVSASKDRADAFSVFVKRLIEEVPWLHHLRPKEGQRDSNLAFDVGPSSAHQSPSVKSVGITGTLTGSRATVIVADDIEVPKNSLTQTQRDRISELVKEFDAVLVPGGDIVYLGTPQCEMSLYAQLPERGYEIRIWPARFPNPTQRAQYGAKLAPIIRERLDKDPSLGTRYGPSRGETTEERFPHLDLVKRETSYGKAGFALQFMLNTSLADIDKYPLKLQDLIIYPCSKERAPVALEWGNDSRSRLNNLPSVGLQGDGYYQPIFVSQEWEPYQGIAMAIDPAGRGTDELGWCVIAMLRGMLYLLDAGGMRGGYVDKNLEALANIAKKYKVNHVEIEDNFGDGMFTTLLSPWLMRIHPCAINGERSSGQKEVRIVDTLEPVFNQHRLVVPPELIQKDLDSTEDYPGDSSQRYQLFYQMTRITRDKGSLVKDDRLDVLSIGVKYWMTMLDIDTTKAEQERRDELFQKDLERYFEHVGVAGPRSSSVTFHKRR